MTDADMPFSPWRVLLPVGAGTALSLIGDASLYVVLPTHFQDAAVPLASIGILLSANRFIRLLFNGPVGMLYDRLPRRVLFVPALFLGALSTAIYALTQGFAPLLLGRLLWGLSWVGIWVGGNTIILDISRTGNRGRWTGVYQVSFFLGASGGAIIGGLLTDGLGYHRAMAVGAGLTLLGAVTALLFLPETRDLRPVVTASGASGLDPAIKKPRQGELVSVFGLLGANRLVIAGVLVPTFGLFLKDIFGDSTQIATISVGVATLTGLALGVNSLISMVAAPVLGALSDHTQNRWRVASSGLVPGIAGFGLLASALPMAPFLGVPLSAVTSGSNQSLSAALIGDVSADHQRGSRLGVMFTVGDLGSAVGPVLAYALIPLLGLSNVYLGCALLFSLMLLVSLHWAAK